MYISNGPVATVKTWEDRTRMICELKRKNSIWSENRTHFFIKAFKTPQKLCKLRLVGIETNPGPRKKGNKAQKNKIKRSSQKEESKVQRGPAADESKTFLMNGPLPAPRNHIADNQIYRVTEQLLVRNYLNSSVSVDTFTAAAFSFSQLGEATTLASVFDQYRIDEIEIWIIPHLTNNNSNTGNPGLLTTVVDYDDATALTTVAAAMAYANALTSNSCAGHYHRFTPHCANALYGGSVFTSFGNMSKNWIDTSSPGVQFFGFKTAWLQSSSVETADMVVRFHVSLRNAR